MTLPRSASIVLALVCSIAGCQAYAPKPLDNASHAREWSSRTAGAEPVAAFAERLARAEGSPEEFDIADGIALPEAEAVALVFNPQLRIARLKANVAKAGADNAGLWQDPELDFGLERILESVDEPWIVGATIGITIPVSGSLRTEKSLAGAEHAAALIRVAEQEWDTRTRLREAWLEWSAAALRAEQTRVYLARLDRVVDIVTRLEEAGEMPRPDAGLFRLERLSRAADLVGLEARTREAELSIRALMGLTPVAPLTLVPRLAWSDAASAGIQDALARNPMLASLRAEYEVAEQFFRHEVRKQYPDITIGPGMGVEDGDPRFLLGLSLPIPLWNRNQRAVAESMAAREVARAAYESAVESLTFDLASAQVRHGALATQRRELETVLVPLVERQDEDVQRIAEAGRIDVFLTLETLTRQHETRVRLIDARADESLAGARIDALVGPPAPIATPSATSSATPSAAPETKP